MAGIFSSPIVKSNPEDDLEIGGTILKFRLPTGFVYREYIRRITKLYKDNERLAEGEDSFMQEDGHYDVEKLHLLMDDNDEGTIIQMAACLKHQFNDKSWDELIDELKQNAHDELMSPSSEICRRILRIDEFAEGDEDEKKPSTPMKSSDTG